MGQQHKAILIVEDSEDDTILLTKMLKRARILNPIRSVESVEDAVCYFKGEGAYKDREQYPEPILVFIDLHLGQRSGFELLGWLQRNRKPLTYGVVVLSGSDVRAINNAYRAGADSFLVKPLQFEDFQQLITRLRGLTLFSPAAGQVVQYGNM